MEHEMLLLMGAAITIGFLHTAAGPDHYLPFIALSRARGWTFPRTLLWTIICGCGHVWSSVALALGGAALGWSLSHVKWLESLRGGLAGWALLLFGIFYVIYGLIRVTRNTRHKHFDIVENGEMYVYEHKHGQTVRPDERHVVTPWVMFIIFVLGPCEPMIPLLYFPAARNSWAGMMLLIIVYTVVTLLTMLLMVAAGYYGFSFLKTGKLEPYTHVLAGFTILICGAGMIWIGW